MLKRVFYATLLFGLFFALSPVMALADSKSTLDGFKEIKFGGSVSQLTALGFDCSESGTCSQKIDVKNNYTLFGQTAMIRISMKDNTVNKIDVTIDVTPDKMKELFSGTLGNPRVHEYVSMMGYRVERNYWLFANGTSISINNSKDVKTTKNMFGKVVPINFSTASYNGRAETNNLLGVVKKGALDKSDF